MDICSQRRLRSYALAFVGVLATAVVAAPPAHARQSLGDLLLTSEMNGNTEFDIGEGVGVLVCVNNFGGPPTAVLRGTLQAVNGVVAPSEPQIYGSLGTNRGACRPFTFRVGGACGAPLVPTLVLDAGDGAPGTPLTALLPTGTTLFTSAFDNVSAPTFPTSDWTRSLTGLTTGWEVVAGGEHAGRNRAFTPNPFAISTASLTTFNIAIPDGSYAMTFYHSYQTEAGFDGGVLEIAIDGGAFTDIITAGGSFLAGGYTGVIDGGKGSPIGGRQAWTGDSGGYVQSRVGLPGAAIGHNVQLRLRFATDSTVGATGWSVDSVVVSSTSCDAVPLDVPWGHRYQTHGNDVSLRWDPPLAGGAADFLLEASTDMGATYPYVFPMGAATTFATSAPSGQYLTRVRAVQGGVISAPSARLLVQVGSALEPSTPRNLLTSVVGSSAFVTWSLDEHGGASTALELQVGSAAGLDDIGTFLFPPGTTSLAAENVPNGIYFLRASQLGPGIGGDPSETVKLQVPGPCTAPAAPPFLTLRRQGDTYFFTWELGALGSAAPTSWALHAGSAPGLSNLAVVPLGGRQFATPAPPPGIYYVRVIAANGCGNSAASNELQLIVP